MIGDRAERNFQEASADRASISRDKFSTWSIILITVVIAFQLFSNDGQELRAHHPSAPTNTISTEAFEHLVEIDTEVKYAYVENFLPPTLAGELQQETSVHSKRLVPTAQSLSPFHATIETALDDSISALRSEPDGTYFARRIILLRMIEAQSPLAPITAKGKQRGFSSPLQAFDIAASESPEARGFITKEKLFWQTTFDQDKIPHQQLPERLRELNQYPTLLFYSLIARQQIFLRAGSFGEAKRVEAVLKARALASLASMGALSAVVAILFLVGVCIWIGVLSSLGKKRRLNQAISIDGDDQQIARSSDASAPRYPSIFARFVIPLPPQIADVDRKLRAGDLLDCFAVYLVSLTGIGTILSIAVGLAPKADFTKLTVVQLTYLEIGLSLISYVGASALAYWYLVHRAKRRETSIKAELGLTTLRLSKNLIYGAAGWGASLALITVVSAITTKLFHALPAPENPALPMLSFAPNTVSRIALYSLAAIAAPFFEETFFRGVLLNALLLRLSPGWACLVVGLMFGGIHPVGVSEALSLAALGFVFAWMAYLRKSLAPSMLAHFMQNSFAYLSVYLSFSMIFRW